jgi:hypothetical protein
MESQLTKQREKPGKTQETCGRLSILRIAGWKFFRGRHLWDFPARITSSYQIPVR